MVSSSINDIILKFQLLKDEILLMKQDIKELQENIVKLNNKMGRFYDLIDGVMGDFKKFGVVRA
ncbi:MAG: hypothetical protein Q8L51_03080 [Candidatus Amesbacteria bacterium]|nr:hypothetical protein [Candidatus Amesbacteria bacterium]